MQFWNEGFSNVIFMLSIAMYMLLQSEVCWVRKLPSSIQCALIQGGLTKNIV